MRLVSALLLALIATLLPSRSLRATDSRSCDLLIVGANESGVACAVQAARMGVKNIILTNDIEWLGGQFSAEGVGCLDEWTGYRGRRVNFPRSGMFLEMVERIRAHNARTYGVAAPGNAYCGTQTIEPGAAAKLFEEFIAPYTEKGTGQITVLRGIQPVEVQVEGGCVRGVTFEAVRNPRGRTTIAAKLTVDSSDWGDVIRLSGAKYSVGVDAKSRFGEEGAPENPTPEERHELNPITYCLVLRESDQLQTPVMPPRYDAKKFTSLDKTPPWVESDMSTGAYSHGGWSVYTHRRLVDRWHLGLAPGTEKTLVNWPVQDYPLMNLPKHVVAALEATEKGASDKSIVEMTPGQRRIVFEDAKQHALEMLYHLQTKVHDRVGDFPQSFRRMVLSEEFGTADRLPPKPYVREGLRLEALYMLKEQDIRAADRNPRWAKYMPEDGVFGFQFNIDFHPTRRKFLDGETQSVWVCEHTKARNWNTDTDRAMFPLRGLVPVEVNGLLGTSKNIGVSSLVQSALRLHGQMMMCGQASGTLAALCLRDGAEPRAVAADTAKVREVQHVLARGVQGPGVILWPYQDVRPDDVHFEAVNMLAARGIWPGDPGSLDFDALATVKRGELARIVVKAARSVESTRGKDKTAQPATATPVTVAAPSAASPSASEARFPDVPETHPDFAFIEEMCARGNLGKAGSPFRPEDTATFEGLYLWLKGVGLPAGEDIKKNGSQPLPRGEAARLIWRAVR